MGVRVKFEYDGPNAETSSVGISKKTFRIDGKEVRLYVYFKEMYFELREVYSKEVVLKGGQTKNRTVLLRQAKRVLERSGNFFKKENRNREVSVEESSNKGIQS